MAVKLPIKVSAAASCQTVCVNAVNKADAPRPKKNTNIIGRRPQLSPNLPAGSEPRPNMMKAPTL